MSRHRLVPARMVRMHGQRRALRFLLRDDFTTAAGAPLTSPRTAEPGPGTLTITDTNSKLSVSGGQLTFATGGVGSGNPGVWGSSLSRVVGRAVIVSVLSTSNGHGFEIGWDSDSAATLTDCLRIGGLTTTVRENGGAVVADTFVNSTSYQAAIIMRSTGFFGFVKGGTFTNWTLLWVGISSTGALTPAVSATDNFTIGTIDLFRVLDLADPFASDYGLVTQRLSGARAALDAFAHEANCNLEFTETTRPSAGSTDFRFRRQDSTNYWQLTINSSGDITLNEVVAGVATQRATAAGAVSSGHRIFIVVDGTTIRVHANNAMRLTYSSASNFATATAGELTALGTSGAVSDVISWPRQLSGRAASLLDASVA